MRGRKLLTMTIIPKTARLVCCASGQKWSSDQPNHPPDPNQPPRPPLPPPPISSLFFISLFHFSNSFFFSPSALSNAFLACSCYQQREGKFKQDFLCFNSELHFSGPTMKREALEVCECSRSGTHWENNINKKLILIVVAFWDGRAYLTTLTFL